MKEEKVNEGKFNLMRMKKKLEEARNDISRLNYNHENIIKSGN